MRQLTLSRAVVLGRLVAVTVAAGLIGCDGAEPSLYLRMQHENPAVRIRAIHQAGMGRDDRAVPYLVDRLTDSERDVRFYAILALKKITGQTMGYQHYAPAADREQAEGRWRQWLEAGRKAPPPGPKEGSHTP